MLSHQEGYKSQSFNGVLGIMEKFIKKLSMVVSKQEVIPP